MPLFLLYGQIIPSSFQNTKFQATSYPLWLHSTVSDLVGNPDCWFCYKAAQMLKKSKAQIIFAVTTKLISAFVFAIWLEYSLFFQKYKISSHLLSFVAAQPGLCLTSSETQVVGLVTKRFKCTLITKSNTCTFLIRRKHTDTKRVPYLTPNLTGVDICYFCYSYASPIEKTNILH